MEQLRMFQDAYRVPVTDIARQAPAQALHSLREASANSPKPYRLYLEEAINCYEAEAYRGAVLMVWSAAIEHIYSKIDARGAGYKSIEAANFERFGASRTYRKIRKKGDLLYLGDANFFLLCEDAGVFNRNARNLLVERLSLRNRCGHPTGYVVGREETVVFIESLINNVINDAMIDWL
ncbi:hypothetical protein ACIGB8_10535 [Promicromonospora sukumoe]|uniref:hypothetical protein n=1 Tax=Promicromonospora sukumoe TaxID=88382 RepID=UPI0037C583F2